MIVWEWNPKPQFTAKTKKKIYPCKSVVYKGL